MLERSTLVSGVVLLVCLALIAPFGVYAVPGLAGGDHSFVVLSDSMNPELEAGDVVVVAETDPATVQEGDVITFVESGEQTPVTHRVIGIDDSGPAPAFETQGDANPEPDAEAVPAENLIGTVVLTIPLVGYVIQFINTPLGFVLFIGIPFGTLLVLSIRSFASVSDGSAGEPTETAERTTLATTATDTNPTTMDTTDTDTTRDPAESPTATDTATDSETATVAISSTDLWLSTLLLALVSPYTIYIALQIPTSITITAAFATTFSLLGCAVLWLRIRLSDDGSRSAPDTESPDPRLDDSDDQHLERGRTDDPVSTDGGCAEDDSAAMGGDR